MKLYYPFKNKFVVGQPFGTNYNTYYAEGGLKGHTGYDMNSFHGDTIYAACDGLIYSYINKDNPDLMRYRAVYQLVDDVEGGVAYEVSYGHLMDILVEPVIEVTRGTPLGTQGNTGDVASGGRKITRQEKMAGSTAGSHLHFQVRLLKKVSKKEKGMKYLMNSEGYFKKDDCYFEIQNYDNGYAGGIDPAQFFVGEYAVPGIGLEITSNLRYGSRGEQVKLLQKKLNIKEDGIFGKKTDQEVKLFQTLHNLTPDGIVGPKTREALKTIV